MKLYDLAAADRDVRPSPYCWLVKFALLHKGLDFETLPLGFTEKENYPHAEHKLLPILVDGEETICDSADILAYLEKNYPDRALTKSAGEQAAAEFYRAWLGDNLYPGLAPLMFVKVFAVIDEKDKPYFRQSREARFNKTLEEFAATPGAKDKVEAALKTLAAPLARHKYLGGEGPNLCDYLVFSPMMWQRVITSEKLYETPQAVDAWRERMLDLYDGYARNAKRAA